MSDPLIVAIVERGGIQGIASDIHARLTPDRPPRDWPSSPRAVTRRLNVHSKAMRDAGWIVTHDEGKNITNCLRWSVQPPEIRPNPSSSPSSDSSATTDTSQTSMTSVVSGPSTRLARDLDVRCADCGWLDSSDGQPVCGNFGGPVDPDASRECAGYIRRKNVRESVG
jgi:hypothetical protein